jgi:hypothetical protein
MRIASGDTAREVAFVAVDATDFATRETGLSSFTVYRMRDGGTPASMTTPTITEVDSTNMPGVYTLLVDEDTTIAAGNDEEEMVLHISHAGMAPVTLTVELFRPKYTEGATLSDAAINAEVDTAIGDAALATAAALATVDANVDAILVDTGTTLPGALLAIEGKVDTVDTVVDGIQTDLSNGTDGLGAIKTAVDGISVSAPTAGEVADAVWTEALADHSGVAGSVAEALDGASAPSAADVAGAVWDEAMAGHVSAGSTGAALNAAGGSGDPWVTALPGAYTTGQAGKILADILADTGTSIPASIANLNDLSAAEVNAQVDLALADYDAPTKAELDAGLAALNDLDAAGVRAAVGLASANLDTQLSDIDTTAAAVLDDTGTTIPGLVASLNNLSAADVRSAVGLSSADLDAQLGAIPTATENADALLNRDMSAVSDTNSRTPLNALRFLRNKWSVAGTTLTVTKEDDSDAAWTATLTADASANPVVGSDPA